MDNEQTKHKNKIPSFIRKRLKLVYLLFLIIPLAYYFLWKEQAPKPTDTSLHPDFLSFSARSTSESRLRLLENNQELMVWDISSKAYKNLEYVGNIKSSQGFHLKADSLNSNDSLFITGICFFSHNKLSSPGNDLKNHISVTNARLTEKDGVPVIVVEKKAEVNISLTPPTQWDKSPPFQTKTLLIMLVFLGAFLLLLIINPPARYFIISLVLALFVMGFGYFTFNNSKGKISVITSAPIKKSEIFYSQTPFFTISKKYTSDGSSDVFTRPLNIETEKYLRFDMGDDTINLKRIKIKISSGFFSKTYNLSETPQSELILNDMVLTGDTYHFAGNDPYVKFTSASFIGNIDFLLFLEHNKFLFLTIIVFLLFLGFHRVVDKRLHRLKLKPAHLTFLLIPLVYFQINQHWIKKQERQNLDYVYFSVKTSHPSIITLLNGNDSITSWVVDSPGYKYLQSKGHFNCSENFFLRITNLAKQDTVSFLSMNLFHGNQTYSLFEKSNTVCKITHADYIGDPDDFSAVVNKSGTPVTVSLMPSNLLTKNNQENTIISVIILVVFIAFIILLLVSPSEPFIVVTSLGTSLFMIIFFWISYDVQSQLRFSTGSFSKRVDFFYNYNPGFEAKRIYLDNKIKNLYEFQIYLSDFTFYRCDVGENNERFKKLFISTETGILRTDFDYRTISSANILMNDMVRCGKEYRVCGSDPYIALSSFYQVNKMHNSFLIRQNLFFFLTIFLFLILITINKYSKKIKLPNFFLCVFFLVTIFTGLIMHLFNSKNLILLSENRRTNPFPVLQVDSSEVLTKKLDSYILDQLPGRRNIISMNNLLQYSIFKQLINNPVIHFGEDGWMFFIGGPAKDNYENKQPLTIQELEKLKSVLVERNEWLKKRGIHFYMVFPPMAQTVYQEYVGPRMRQHYKQTKAEQLLEYLKLNSDLDVIDICTPLKNVKETGSQKLYFKNNCHWNYFGAYVAYSTMINYIKRDFPNIGDPLTSKEIKWIETKGYNPDLLKLMEIDKFYSSREYSPVIIDKIITDTIYPFYLDLWSPAPPAIVLTNRTSNPTMYMYGDSYSGALLPFLFCNFSRSVFIWTPLFQPAIIDKEKPDMVIQEMVDMSINALLMKNKPFPELADTVRK